MELEIWSTSGPDKDNPQPNVWAECPICHTAWVWCQYLSLNEGKRKWAWGRDCKHKSEPILMTVNGPLEGGAAET